MTDKTAKKFKIISKGAIKRLAILFASIAVALTAFLQFAVNMPGSGHTGPLPALTDAQRAAADRLERDVRSLVENHPGRSHMAPARYLAAAQALRVALADAGVLSDLEAFEMTNREGNAANVVGEVPGTSHPDRIVVVGAHYDAHLGMPGADDNASGVAGVLELARRFSQSPAPFTIRFVLFANEEPPHFMTPDMGSYVHAAGCKQRSENVAAMISVEMIGYFDDSPGSQAYPFPLSLFYPDTGDFVAFVGNVSSGGMVRSAVRTFRDTTPFPSEGVAMPSGIPGIGYSDHWSFWEHGYKAMMVTDTSFYRNPHYHTSRDLPSTLDYERMARAVDGIERVVRELASAPK